MDLVHLLGQYCSMNTAHLSDDELRHELLIRDVDMGDESRSKRERTLRTLLKAEKEKKESISYKYDDIDLIEELKWCDEQQQAVKSVLEGRKIQKAPDQKFKTKLLHILFRIKRLRSYTEAEDELNSIAVIAGKCISLLNKFYSITSPIVQVREAEIQILNESLRKIREQTEGQDLVDPPGAQTETEKPNENAVRDENEELSQHSERNLELEGAVGGTNTAELSDKDRVSELSDENAKLKEMVNQLMQRIHALETAHVPKPRQLGQNVSTPLDRRSVQSEIEAREKINVDDFYDWVKARYGSMESVVERNRFPQPSQPENQGQSQINAVD